MSDLDWVEAGVSVICPEETRAFKISCNSILKDENNGRFNLRSLLDSKAAWTVRTRGYLPIQDSIALRLFAVQELDNGVYLSNRPLL